MKLIPNDARVIVKPIEEDTVRPSGLVLPESGKAKPIRGEVIAVGPGAYNTAGTERIPLTFEVGQIVVFDRYSGLEYRPDRTGEALLILRAHDVLATEEKLAGDVIPALADGGRMDHDKPAYLHVGETAPPA